MQLEQRYQRSKMRVCFGRLGRNRKKKGGVEEASDLGNRMRIRSSQRVIDRSTDRDTEENSDKQNRWFVFAIPLPRRGARAYIVGVVDHLYLATRLPMWLTLSSYASTMPAVLAVRDASTGRVIGLTCVRLAVRLLGYRPYLCQVGRTTAGDSALPGRPHDHWRPHTYVRPASRVGSTTSADQLSEGAMM
ncbi:hypothetical protein GW17_00044907 [Ensete ventricosum]|nr:hypothetical protein GW17_00044907 [Ensete ventricosum]